jgi:hypothetical protein
MNLTFWTVSLYFFRNVHGIDQLRNKETYTFLYFFAIRAKTRVSKLHESRFEDLSSIVSAMVGY